MTRGVPPEVERALLALRESYLVRGDLLREVAGYLPIGALDPTTDDRLALVVVPVELLERIRAALKDGGGPAA